MREQLSLQLAHVHLAGRHPVAKCQSGRPTASPVAMQVDITRIAAIASCVVEMQRPATSRLLTAWGTSEP